MAKASVLWLVGEYCSLVPKIAPDVLRKAAKSFTEEVSAISYTNLMEVVKNSILSKFVVSFTITQIVTWHQ